MWQADKFMYVMALHAAGQPKQLGTIKLVTQFMQVVQEGRLVNAACKVVRAPGSFVLVAGRLLCEVMTMVSANGIWK